MKTVKELEEEIEEIEKGNFDGQTPLKRMSDYMELKKTLTQTKEIIKLINGLIDMRLKSENRIISNYETIFSINDLKMLLQKIRGEK